MDIDAVNIGIRAGKIYEFHRTDSFLGMTGILCDGIPFISYSADLTRLNIADQGGSDHIQGACF